MSIEPTSDPLAPTPSPGSHADLDGLSARVATSVWHDAREMTEAQRGQPEWLWYEHDGCEVSLGRWKRDARQAPYVRADLALAASPTAPAGEPVAWMYEYQDVDRRWRPVVRLDKPEARPGRRNFQPLGVISAASPQGGDDLPVDLIARITIDVRRDGSDGTRFQFAQGVNWHDAEIAIARAQCALQAEYENRLKCPASPSKTPTAPAQGGEIVRHVKRGTEYEVLGEAEAQVAVGGYKVWPKGYDPYSDADAVRARFIHDGLKLTVYRCPKTNKLWCRFTEEFRDGRFVPASPSKTPEG